MRRSILTAALLGVLSPAAALQGQRPVTLGLAGGVSLPQGRFGDGVDPGWHALATLSLGSQMHLHPLALRIDGACNQFAFAGTGGGTVGGAPVDGSQRTISVTLNPTYRLPSAGWPLSPYLIGGAGAYNLGCTGDATCDATTRFGWNAGLGTKFAGLRLRGFLEARYHRVALKGGDVHYFPLTLGLTF
jgi:hypothetical protein